MDHSLELSTDKIGKLDEPQIEPGNALGNAFPVVKIEEYQDNSDETPIKVRRRGGKAQSKPSSPQPASLNISQGATRRRRSSSRTSSKNLKSTTDISPASMIFRNLLILEDDLRRQAREQKILKWQFTLFLSALVGIAAAAFYELYFSQESVKGIYKVMLEFVLIFILVTVVLFHLSGEYRRTIVIPRKFFTSTNKGIRQFNVKLVKVKSSIPDLCIDLVRWVCRKSAVVNLLLSRKCLPARIAEDSWLLRFWTSVALRSQPRIGAVDVKLILNPRAFSAEIREGWEIYRDEFWAREGARRRKKVNETSPRKDE
ncbi:Nem1-Spo7 phosphatase regulatory subunit SPO7 [Lachancea thermotolerans CBS 6340]|uniref:KLTH0D02882p n=1 Tax=Lachancea thermotolerans (strain ATCC 56472 / CBS 6340 / NRRL Y-8284) TaxID=559295 RepID=C5DG71_LACTC|nr:KLTH0D02882p [Lachancea thermotolerans CBS 6340]CAR22413.1 KLTH0D02882p [Lachancea thermotolerans CBS 6340]